METNVAGSPIRISPTPFSRIHEVDWEKLMFGKVFADHMLVARVKNGVWGETEIVPYGPLSFAPSMSALNYGQAVFEGMKAFKSPAGRPLLFRPEENFRRINQSASRLAMPEIPAGIFLEGLKELIRLDQAWIPQPEIGSLYIRPAYFATEEAIGVRASDSYLLSIFTSPVGPYYAEPVSLLVNKDFVRAAQGGTGSAKAAGNYASAMLPDKLAKAQGYHNILWLDARENRFIEECGTMNVFFVINGVVVTPPLNGTILPGITRHSLIHLFREAGHRVDIRPITIDEVREAYLEGQLDDAFGAGTAATVTHIARIGYQGMDIVLPPTSERKLSNWAKQCLTNIRLGLEKGPEGWVVAI